MIIADILVNIASRLSSKLKAINVSLVNKGQTEAESFDDIPAKIDAITSGGTDTSAMSLTSCDISGSWVLGDNIETQIKVKPSNTSGVKIKDIYENCYICMYWDYADFDISSLPNNAASFCAFKPRVENGVILADLHGYLTLYGGNSHIRESYAICYYDESTDYLTIDINTNHYSGEMVFPDHISSPHGRIVYFK